MTKLFFFIFALGLTLSCQNSSSAEKNQTGKKDTIDNGFYLEYSFGGLGSNQFETFYPAIEISGKTLSYTIEKRTDKFEIQTSFGSTDTVWTFEPIMHKVKFRQSSIDSILYLVKDVHDTTIFETNPDIHSGGIHFLTIARQTDTIKYELMNTYDWTALKISAIVNKYLPTDNKIWATAELITDREEYWRRYKKSKATK